MDKTVSVAEAKNNLPAIIHEVEKGTTVMITRHGRSVAVMVRPGEYEKIKEEKRNFLKSLGNFRNLLSAEGVIFSDREFSDLRDRTAGRPISWEE